MQARTLSVIAPCLDEQEVIAEFHKRLVTALAGIPEAWEVIYVDDGSTDRTPQILKEICDREDNVSVLRLSRCFGHQLALTAGLHHAKGDAVVIIDSDLQDPPAVILEMLARWREGSQVVYGQRISRDGETRFKLLACQAFYWLVDAISDIPIPHDVGDFRLMDREVVNALCSMPEQHRVLRTMICWLGYRQEMVAYRREPRFAGVPSYSFSKLVRLALDGLVSSSTLPLRLVSILGLGTLIAGTLGGLGALLYRINAGVWPGETLSTLLIALFFSGLQLFCFGVMGEYVSRIYGEVKRRPLYLVSERFGRAARPPATSAEA